MHILFFFFFSLPILLSIASRRLFELFSQQAGAKPGTTPASTQTRPLV